VGPLETASFPEIKAKKPPSYDVLAEEGGVSNI
jgi:hypothetical protein